MKATIRNPKSRRAEARPRASSTNPAPASNSRLVQVEPARLQWDSAEIRKHEPNGTLRRCRDWLAIEEPLEIRIRGEAFTMTMRTPGHDRELAAGLLFSERVITGKNDLVEIAHCRSGASRENILNVFLAPSVRLDPRRSSRQFASTSSCGLCGKFSIEHAKQYFRPVSSRAPTTAAILKTLPMALHQAQTAFAKTGGLHAAALFDLNGNLLVLREDIGRHNAVDKVVGQALFNDLLPLKDAILLVSGRASFEIMQKALAARIPIVVALSAPSNLAADFAHEHGQTLVGFLRGATFNVYSHPKRIGRPDRRDSETIASAHT